MSPEMMLKLCGKTMTEEFLFANKDRSVDLLCFQCLTVQILPASFCLLHNQPLSRTQVFFNVTKTNSLRFVTVFCVCVPGIKTAVRSSPVTT